MKKNLYPLLRLSVFCVVLILISGLAGCKKDNPSIGTPIVNPPPPPPPPPNPPATNDSAVSVTATAGTFGPTIYKNLKTGVDAINAGTHMGAVTVTVVRNSSETASAILKGSGTGASSYSSILIKPATGTNAAISGSITNSLLVLDGAMNVTIDGSNVTGSTTKNLTISNGSTSGSAIIFLNGASNNVIKNSVIQSATANSGVIVLSTSSAAAGNNNNTIQNNDISRSMEGSPLIGVYNIGTSGKPNTGNIYRNNRVFDFLYYGFSDGDANGSIGFSDNTLLEANEFYNTAAQYSNIIAIFINNEKGISNMRISKNKIHSLTITGPFEGITGILLFDAVSVTVDNNFISLSNSPSELKGISQETGVGAVIKIYNNTILISGTTGGTTRSFAFFKNWLSTGDDIRNNIFVNTRVSSGTGKQYAFIKILGGTFIANYNNLVSTGNVNNYIGGVGTSSAPTLYQSFAEWQTGSGQDANSISVNPFFVSTTDLHLTPVGNKDINNKGTPVSEITTDIDNEIRSTTTPDMGADEFTT